MFNPQHYGIYFTDEHIQQARSRREHEPFQAAWAMLRGQQQTDPLADSLRYKFDEDVKAGEKTVEVLRRGNFNPGGKVVEMVVAATMQAQCFEMVRDHPNFSQAEQAAWLQAFAAHIGQLNQPPYELMHFERLWLNLLNLVSGIVLEDETLFQNAVTAYKDVIAQDVHPEGYILKAVEAKDGHGLYRMLLSAQALILTAEAATHAGEDLWHYEMRGVSAMTPTPYLLYYYYYPDKWRWDEAGNRETVQVLYKQYAGFWEMAQRRTPSRDRKLLLKELRPIYDVWGGGLTTLTHGGTAEVKRKGLFG
jgi:hypothetical protein